MWMPGIQKRAQPNRSARLTDKRLDVLACLAAGLSVKEASTILDCTEYAIRKRIESLKSAFGARTQAGLVWKACLDAEVAAGVQERIQVLDLPSQELTAPDITQAERESPLT